MKIGILTYHRSHNYGALLQAIALRSTLEKLGHEVCYIDYWPKYHQDMYRAYSRFDLKSMHILGKIKYILKTTLVLPHKLKRIGSFKKFINDYISPHLSSVTDYYDIIIYGSDQIWRKQPRFYNEFNPIYFGQNDFSAKRHITYAASMGNINLSQSDEKQILEWVKKFAYISVRENDLAKKLEDIGIKNVSTVLDPTLLMNAAEWNRIINITPIRSKPYVLFYDLTPDSFDVRKIQNFAKSKHLDLIILKGSANKIICKNNEYATAGPQTMISLIANADYVFTSSYHGLAFSIIFEKEFAASFKTNQGRARSLLSTLNITNRLINDKKDPYPTDKIDYHSVMNLLNQKRNESINSLLESCKNE